MAQAKPEVWLRGALAGIPALVQPVAHALLQAQEEIHEMMNAFPDELLWQRPAGVASPGFHLKHIAGVLDRLFTYAAGKSLTGEQLNYLKAEGEGTGAITVRSLLNGLDAQIASSLDALKAIDAATVTEPRGVGRQQLPSTVLGLLFHAAEHTMRHTGQLMVTVKILLSEQKK
ncbi:metal-dependent hydrolase [Niastella vici]|uniref:Metal-dependent hydrolase n=1 Tax=Niastella vici TaxID=1703345 RepID=A0A1V9G945_9BACT|nr:DinB family protein [Niastella vici]OQP66998.1 metal-dependent hydrolase [Niastella vici]